MTSPFCYPTLKGEAFDQCLRRIEQAALAKVKNVPGFRGNGFGWTYSEKNRTSETVCFIVTCESGKYSNFRNFDGTFVEDPVTKRRIVIRVEEQPAGAAVLC